MALPDEACLPIPDSLAVEGSEDVEPVELEGIDGEAVPVEGVDGMPVLGAGDGVEGTEGVPPVLGIGLPEGLLVGLGIDGAPPPELVLHPPAIRIATTAPMDKAAREGRATRASNGRVFIELYLWSRRLWCRPRRPLRHPR